MACSRVFIVRGVVVLRRVLFFRHRCLLLSARMVVFMCGRRAFVVSRSFVPFFIVIDTYPYENADVVPESALAYVNAWFDFE